MGLGMDPSYNNSFSSFNSGAQGEIVLVADSQKKSKKGLLLFLLLLISVLLVGALIIFLVVGNRSSSLESLEEQYLNLLMDDERNYSPLSEQKKNYDELNTVLNNIQEAVKRSNLNNEKRGQMDFLINNSRDLLFLYFISTALVDTNASYNYFLEKGSLKGFLDEYGYSEGTEIKNDMIGDLRLMVDNAFSGKKKYYESLVNAGCIDDAGINYECAAGDVAVEMAESDMFSSKAVVESYVDRIMSIIVANANEMKKITTGGKNGQD